MMNAGVLEGCSAGVLDCSVQCWRMGLLCCIVVDCSAGVMSFSAEVVSCSAEVMSFSAEVVDCSAGVVIVQ